MCKMCDSRFDFARGTCGTCLWSLWNLWNFFASNSAQRAWIPQRECQESQEFLFVLHPHSQDWWRHHWICKGQSSWYWMECNTIQLQPRCQVLSESAGKEIVSIWRRSQSSQCLLPFLGCLWWSGPVFFWWRNIAAIAAVQFHDSCRSTWPLLSVARATRSGFHRRSVLHKKSVLQIYREFWEQLRLFVHMWHFLCGAWPHATTVEPVELGDRILLGQLILLQFWILWRLGSQAFDWLEHPWGLSLCASSLLCLWEWWLQTWQTNLSSCHQNRWSWDEVSILDEAIWLGCGVSRQAFAFWKMWLDAYTKNCWDGQDFLRWRLLCFRFLRATKRWKRHENEQMTDENERHWTVWHVRRSQFLRESVWLSLWQVKARDDEAWRNWHEVREEFMRNIGENHGISLSCWLNLMSSTRIVRAVCLHILVLCLKVYLSLYSILVFKISSFSMVWLLGIFGPSHHHSSLSGGEQTCIQTSRRSVPCSARFRDCESNRNNMSNPCKSS